MTADDYFTTTGSANRVTRGPGLPGMTAKESAMPLLATQPLAAFAGAAIALAVLYLLSCMRVVNEFERGVVFRLGPQDVITKDNVSVSVNAVV